MALQSSGPLKLSEIQTEFGGSNPISLSEYYAGGAQVSSGVIGFPGGTSTPIPASSTIHFSNFYGSSNIIHGSVLLTSGSGSYTFPTTTGNVINVICIGGGGGGGGGSQRTNDTGPYTGGGGGGSGAAASATLILTGNRTISYVVGAGGAGVGGRDGSYSGASPGNPGGSSMILYNSVQICAANGGGGGGSAIPAGSHPNINNFATSGVGGMVAVGTQILSSSSGQTSYFARYNNTATYFATQPNGGGGYGAPGFDLNTTSHTLSVHGAVARGGIGNDVGAINFQDLGGYSDFLFVHDYTPPTFVTPEIGLGYGGGGGGGGKDNEYLQHSSTEFNGAAGGDGIIFMWW